MERRCPICERATSEPTCPEHGVPVIDPQILATVSVQPQIGTVIADRYVVQDILGVGGMAAVYVAEDSVSGQLVALKFLRPTRALDMRHIKRFYLEARALAAIRHPSVIDLIDFGIDEGIRMPFLAMKLVEGTTLTAEIERRPLSEARAAYVGCCVAQALAAVHAVGFAHRDLKPDNIMITRGGGVVVLDFGVAKSLRLDDDRITLPGASVGTPEFMSPEQARGSNVDARSDLYGLGCVLYSMVTGAPPFHGESARDVMTKHVTTQPDPLPALLADGAAPSAPFVRLLFALLAKRAEDRPVSAASVALVLEELTRGNVASALSRLEQAMGRAVDRARARAEIADVATGHAVSLASLTRRPPSMATAVVPVDLDAPYDEPGTATSSPTQWAERPVPPSERGTARTARALDMTVTAGLRTLETPANPIDAQPQLPVAAPPPRSASMIPEGAPQGRHWVALLLVLASTGAGIWVAAWTSRAEVEVTSVPLPLPPEAVPSPVAVMPSPSTPEPAPVESTAPTTSPRARPTTRPRPSPSVVASVAPEPTSLVSLSSEPAGADVRLADGSSVGKTPVRLRIDGELEVKIVLEGFMERKITLKAADGSRAVKLVPLW